MKLNSYQEDLLDAIDYVKNVKNIIIISEYQEDKYDSITLDDSLFYGETITVKNFIDAVQKIQDACEELQSYTEQVWHEDRIEDEIDELKKKSK
tara:strand:- start:299 stop:580 length:282 start_codon:yes stop_codon:yes gene_type:complete